MQYYPSLTYACETWTLTVKEKRKLAVAQKRMERAMLGITLLDRVPNEVIRRRTMLTDILDMVWRRKVKWATNLARMNEERWSKCLTEWIPLGRKRNVGGQYMRWEDDLKERMVEHGWQGQQWPTVARSSARQFLQLMGPAEI